MATLYFLYRKIERKQVMKDYKIYSISELPFCVVETCDVFQVVLDDSSSLFVDPTSLNNDNDEEDIAPSFEDESIARNNKRNTLVGNLGEEIAQAYLRTKYSIVSRISVKKGKSGLGYDIIANGNLCFEVKTSTAKENIFEITINELRTANDKGHDYHIFYIAVDANKRIANGFIFNNPIKRFDTDFNILIKQNSIFEPTRFRGKLQDIHLTEKVDLTEFLIEILRKKPEYDEKLFAKVDK